MTDFDVFYTRGGKQYHGKVYDMENFDDCLDWIIKCTPTTYIVSKIIISEAVEH
ncbi:MAG: hypothetical protein GWN01_05395 [Nitrosopumilaceae archaeon]|nr:hypothetical protein [Nitrosopumilaceae archaeon]NIU86780.1 hypothetical protein [Nitrosopumilaceae archaeon]NIX60980.1 hypothetical protein [Nitrosopumilaceae archaeon]